MSDEYLSGETTMRTVYLVVRMPDRPWAKETIVAAFDCAEGAQRFAKRTPGTVVVESETDEFID